MCQGRTLVSEEPVGFKNNLCENKRQQEGLSTEAVDTVPSSPEAIYGNGATCSCRGRLESTDADQAMHLDRRRHSQSLKYHGFVICHDCFQGLPARFNTGNAPTRGTPASPVPHPRSIHATAQALQGSVESVS